MKLASRYAHLYIGGERFLKPQILLEEDFYFDHYQAEIYYRDRNPRCCNYISPEGLVCHEIPQKGTYCNFHRFRIYSTKKS
jgi:hypothetical protein